MRYANLNPACQVIESGDQDSARARRCIPGTSLHAPLPASENYSKGGGAHITFHLGRCESSQNDQTSRHRLRQSKLSPGKNRDADDRPFAAGFFPVPLIQRSHSRRADRARRGTPGKRTTQRGSRPDSAQDSAPSNDEDHNFRRRRLPEKGVEKPACPTTPALPFPVRSEGDADPGWPRRRRPRRPARARAGEPDRRTDRVRPGVDVRAEHGPADPRPDRGRLHPDLRRQAASGSSPTSCRARPPTVPTSPRAWTTSARATPWSCRAWTGSRGPCRT